MLACRDEKQFQSEVQSFAEDYGWNCFHQLDSRGSREGLSDCIMWRDPEEFSVCAVVAELKIPPNKPTPAQELFLAAMGAMGVPAYLWYPEHWPIIRAVITSEGAKPCPKALRGIQGKQEMTPEQVLKMFRLNKPKKIPPYSPTREPT